MQASRKTTKRNTATQPRRRPPAALAMAADGADERLRRNLEDSRIKDPAIAATVKQSCDVARAAAVLLDFAAQQPRESSLDCLATSVSNSLGLAADALDKLDPAPEAQQGDFHHNDVDGAIFHLAAIIRGASSTLNGVSEAISDENIPPLARASAAALREAADRFELRLLASPGTLADATRSPYIFAACLERELARLTAIAQADAAAAAGNPGSTTTATAA